MEILASCLARSPDILSGRVSLTTHEGYSSASVALNAGIDASDSPIVVLAHQDVYLPKGWIEQLSRQVRYLDENGIRWAILGVIGVPLNGGVVGQVWSSGLHRLLGRKVTAPVDVISIDECLIIVNRSSGVRFDERLPSWHLYATDVILDARKRGFSALVIDAPLIHNSRPTKTLRGGYASAYYYMQRKWKDYLPIPTLVAPLTSGRLTLLRAQWRRIKVNLRRRAQRNSSPIDPTELTRKFGWES